jgi:hypothetical protein
LAKSELLLCLAVSAQRWADEVGDDSSHTRPFAEWDDSDRFRALARTYDLTGPDLADVLARIAEELEARAIRCGYDEHWDPA